MCDWERDVNAIGVPLVHAESNEIYAFNCGGPSFTPLSEERLETEVAPLLLDTVRDVHRSMRSL